MARQQQNGKAAAAPRRPLTELMDRQPPFDIQAEIGVLGSIMLLPAVYADVSQILKADDFYDDANRGIYMHLVDIAESGKPIDDVLLVNSLKAGMDYEAVGGAAYLSKVINAVPNAAHARYYAEIVREKSIYRSLIYQSTVILRDAYDESCPASDLIEYAEAGIRKIADQNIQVDEPILLGKSAQQVAHKISNPVQYGAINRCFFGLESVDERLGPIVGGEVAVVAARPGNGKTSFAMQILRHSAEQDRPALMVALEMGHQELTMRELSRIANIDSREVRGGQVSDTSKADILAAADQIGDLPLWIWSPPLATFSQIRTQLRRMVDRRKIKVAAIDYLSLIEVDNEMKSRKRDEQVAFCSRRLKALAKELQIPIIVLQQLNRDAEDTEPGLRHLRESGAIEQDADIVMFLHHGACGKGKAVIPHWKRNLIVAKFRAGPLGDVMLGWSGKKCEFQSVSKAAMEAADAAADPEQKKAAKEEAELEQKRIESGF